MNGHPTERDIALAAMAMRLAIEGDLFPECEFQTLIGLERHEVQAIADAWPNVDLSSPEVRWAVLGSLNNLIGYPHGREDLVAAVLTLSGSELNELYWRLASLFPSTGTENA